jgi:AraC-like DNA-binding protein/mannose-6-phosphate isomerase-like protein (cupin superfamily)
MATITAEKPESVSAYRFREPGFLNGDFSGRGDSVYHIYFFPQGNAGFFNLNGNWTDIIPSRLIFIPPKTGFSVKCEEDSLDCFHVTYRSRAAITGSPSYFTAIPPERRHAFTCMNIALAAACLGGKQDEALECLRSILEMMDAMVSGNRFTYATRHEGSLLRDIPRHFHDNEYQIEYFAEGDGTIYAGNRWMEFFPGSLCFIPPKITHEIIYPKLNRLDNYSIKFKLGASFHLRIPAEAFVTGVSAQQQSELLGLLKKIVGDYVQDIPIPPEMMHNLVNIISEINGTSMDAAKKNNIVGQIKRIVNANIPKNIRLTDIACQLDLSQEYVSRHFRKHTGQTLTSYITSQRLESGIVMLKNTNMPFKQIAAECGFKNVNYFHTIFKKHFSLTPQDFRKNGGRDNLP